MTMLVRTEQFVRKDGAETTAYVFLAIQPSGYYIGRSLKNDPLTVEMWIQSEAGWQYKR